jgi:hypothetical protein
LKEEDLKMVWYCDDCGSSFFFNSDALDHGKLNQHFRITKYDLRSGRLANESSG